MWIDPKNTNFMLVGNDGGFRISTDRGQTWRRADLPTETAFAMAFDMDTPFRVYGSFQDHGSYRGVVDISNGRENLKPIAFESAPGGEYCEHAIDPRNPNIVYSGKLERTDYSVPAGAAAAVRRAERAGARRGSAGGTAARHEHPSPDRSGRRSAAHAGPGADPPLAARSRHRLLRRAVSVPLERSRQHVGKADWRPELQRQTRLGDIPHQLVITISESPKKKGLVYTGTDDGRLHMSLDDGKEWVELTATLPRRRNGSATVLASKYDERTVYVAQQGRYDEDFAVRLYKSTDFGRTFRSIAGNLPGGPINMIREDPVSPNVLYAATTSACT